MCEEVLRMEALVAIHGSGGIVRSDNAVAKKYAVVRCIIRTVVGEVHLLMNNFDSAAREFTKCVELFPELASTRENLARTLLSLASSSHSDDDATSKAKAACIAYANAEDTDFSAAWRALAKLPQGKDEDDASYYGQRRSVFVGGIFSCRAEQSDFVGISRAVVQI